MPRLSHETEQRDDLLREIETELDSDLGLDREEIEITREKRSTRGKEGQKLTPMTFAAYAVGGAATLWIVLRLFALVWPLLKIVLIVGLIGYGVLWWLGRKNR